MAKKYVLIKDTKEKLEVLEYNENTTYIKNSKGQKHLIPNTYLITYEKYLFDKQEKCSKIHN